MQSSYIIIIKKIYARECKILDSGGSIIGSVRAKEDKGTVYIGKLVIHPQHRHHGYGTRLLEEIEQYCPEKRYELFTSIRSKENIRLYQRMGYRTNTYKNHQRAAELINNNATNQNLNRRK